MNNPHKNLIRIYSVNKNKKEIIMEKVNDNKYGDTSKKNVYPTHKEINKFLKDIKLSLKQLKKLGIVYADLKMMNTGYSKKDKVWKIFDFDFSAIFKRNNNNEELITKIPLVQPTEALKDAKINLAPSEIDDYLFKYLKYSDTTI